MQTQAAGNWGTPPPALAEPARPRLACFPQVRPTSFGVVDDHTMFVAFEGRATADTPLFKARKTAARRQRAAAVGAGYGDRQGGGALACRLVSRRAGRAC